MKRIAIFCDGTWNTPDKMENGKPCSTNVVKMANAMKPISGNGVAQKLYYDNGIGTEGGILKKVFDGATGTGISRNIREAYRYIIETYEPGDELFFFGFSRGAFTVRSISGLIRNAGILERKNIDLIPQAYRLYSSRNPVYHPKELETTLFRKTFAVEELTKIKFIGVWDTVGALGNPLLLNGVVSRKNEFHDTDLSSRVQHAYHALAVDEKRKNFQATLWHQQKDSKDQVLEQVWFPGVHSDVGGGYPETPLSDIALEWMLEKAKGCGLSFNDIEMHHDPLGMKHETLKGFYKLGKILYRPIGLAIPGQGNTNESLHPSVLERYRNDPSYRPKNLVYYFEKHPL
jgi:uncharacterized protein (DUF2235 family)